MDPVKDVVNDPLELFVRGVQAIAELTNLIVRVERNAKHQEGYHEIEVLSASGKSLKQFTFIEMEDGNLQLIP
ncbi:MAG: hypothetical protein Q7S73_02275 [bacterium]|nr:hypothetical protein [bacterium]